MAAMKRNLGMTGKEEPAEAEKKPMSWKKELWGLLCLLLALALFCAATVPVLTPKRHDYGAVWGMYRQEPENSVDTLFFGSSLAYCDIIPSVLYEETGVSSFVMAGPTQPMPVTYRYLREACKTQSPKTVFIEVTGLVLKRDRSLKTNLTFLPWGAERLSLIFEETRGSDRTGLLFPLYAYHDRWDKLSLQDVKEGLLGYEADPLAGYTFLDEAMPIEGLSLRKVEVTPEEYERDAASLEKIVEFCKEQGIRPIFLHYPLPQRLDGQWLNRITEAQEAQGNELVDFKEDIDKMGFTLSTDFYDPRHLNYRGAEKFSRYLAERLPEWGVSPAGNGDDALWRQRAARFDELRKEADSKPVRLNPAKE